MGGDAELEEITMKIQLGEYLYFKSKERKQRHEEDQKRYGQTCRRYNLIYC